MRAVSGVDLCRVVLISALLLAFGHASVTTAQTTATPSEEKTDPKPGGFRDWIAQTLATSSGDRKDGIAASVGIIVAGSGLSGGVGYKRLDAFKGIDFQGGATVSLRRYQEHYFAFGKLASRSSSLEFDTADAKAASVFNDSLVKEPGSAVYVEARYRDFPRHTFYGGGIGSQKSDRSDYALSGTAVEGVWQWQLRPTLGVSVRGGVLDFDIGPGTNEDIVNFEDRFVPASVQGGLEQPRYWTLGIGIVRDTRERPGAPYDGTFVGVSVRRYATGADNLDFTRVIFDLRTYLTPLTERGVIALRALTSNDLAGDNGGPPFYLQQYMGGGETLRGFRSYRFHDHSFVHFTAEYRWRAHRFVEVAPFVDTGSLARGLTRLGLDDFKVTPGIALRARTDRRTLARLEWAKSDEGHRIVIGTGPLF